MSERMADSPDDRTLTIQAAAYLCAKEHLPQQRVAEVLGVSQALVSRMLREAENNGWLLRETRLAEDILGARIPAIQNKIYPHKVRPKADRLARENGVAPVRGIHVFDSGSDRDDEWELRLTQFARAAAETLRDYLANSRVCGVTWGATVGRIIEGLESLMRPGTRSPFALVRFVPTSAELLHTAVSDAVPDLLSFSSTALAVRLDRIGGSTKRQSRKLSLTGLPAVIPGHFMENDKAEKRQRMIAKILDWSKDYLEVFGKLNEKTGEREGGLVDQMDTVLTSIGSFSTPRKPRKDSGAEDPREKPNDSEPALAFANELIRAQQITNAELVELAVGDIGGALIPRDGLTEKQKKRLQAIEANCTGLRMKHLKRIAEDANRTGKPGVIVVAIGEGKADILRNCMRHGLVSQFLTDSDLIKRLDQLMPGG